MTNPTTNTHAACPQIWLSAVRCGELVSFWNREEAKSRKHAAQWESGDNWKRKPDPWMAEVCRMRADTLRLCAMQIEEANNVFGHGGGSGGEDDTRVEKSTP